MLFKAKFESGSKRFKNLPLFHLSSSHFIVVIVIIILVWTIVTVPPFCPLHLFPWALVI